MRAFTCPSCGRLVTFESSHCPHCRSDIGLDWDGREIVALGARSRCAGAAVARCDTVVGPAVWCESCTLTRARPADDDRAGLQRFIRAEAAKRRLTFELGEPGLPIVGWRERAGGLAFDLLSQTRSKRSARGMPEGSSRSISGRPTRPSASSGASSSESPTARSSATCATRLGHYYQDMLAPQSSATRADCRALFGDDRADYAAAMATHDEHGPPAGWEAGHVSAYATMHPWEDWAETFAHYPHIRDTLQTAEAHGVRVVGPRVATTDAAPPHSDPEAPARDLRALMAAWFPLTYALNAINRSMGAADVYAFALTPEVQRKLAFVDRRVRAGPPRDHA